MNKLDNCQEALQFVHSVEESLVRCGCFKQLANIEKSVLNLASVENVYEGVFYCALVEDGEKMIARYLEAGLPFKGFLHKNEQTLCDTISQQAVHLYCIHTDEDMKRHSHHMKEKGSNKSIAQKTSSGTSKTRSRIGEKWKRLVFGDKPQSQCLNSDALAMNEVIHQKCHIKAFIVIARRANPNPNQIMHRFLTAGGFPDNEATVQHWYGLLNDFSLHGGSHTSVSLKQLCDSDTLPSTLTEQFRVISCLNNYHWGRRPKKDQDIGKLFNTRTAK